MNSLIDCIPVQIGGDPVGFSHRECAEKAAGISDKLPFEPLLFDPSNMPKKAGE